MENGKYSILNRGYKPCGLDIVGDHVKYGDYPLYKANRMSAKIAENISWNNDPNTEVIYLYNDGCVPFSFKSGHSKSVQVQHTVDYMNRLAKISQWEIQD